MRITEPINTQGIFWQPDTPETKIPGTLNISQEGEITVALSGPVVDLGLPVALARSDTGVPIRRIVGTVAQGGPVTLDRCWVASNNPALRSVSINASVLAEVVCIGAQYEEGEELCFQEFSFSVEGLDVWLDTSGIETGWDDEGNSFWIRYYPLDPICFALAEGTDVTFRFDWHTQGNLTRLQTDAGVRQTSKILLSSKETKPLAHYTDLALRISYFLSLALDQVVCIESMTGYLDADSRDGRKIPISVYGMYAPWNDSRPTIQWHEALFRYPDVANRIKMLLPTWLDNWDQFMPAIRLYFSSKAQASPFWDVELLWLAQGLETLHRRASQETALPQADFDDLMHKICGVCSKQEWDWLGPRIANQNHLSFRTRLRRLVEPFDQWFGGPKERRAFINRVYETRNYLTHYDESTTNHRVDKPRDFVAVRDNMSALFQLHLMKLAGLDEDEINSMVETNRRWRRKYGLTELTD